MQPAYTFIAPTDRLIQKIKLDNLFRLAVSLSTFGVAFVLWQCHVIPHFRPLITLLLVYNFTVAIGALLVRLRWGLRAVDLILNTTDITVITYTLHYTGGPQSPFFYLYMLPFLVQAFHYEMTDVLWNGVLTLAAYFVLLFMRGEIQPAYWGQMIFLSVVIGTAIATVRILRKKQDALQRGILELGVTVEFLNELDAVAIDLPIRDMQKRIATRLNDVLKPFHVFARLWVSDEQWKTLHGIGEHPGARLGAPTHLPVTACPALALRKPFLYADDAQSACPTEQFDYSAHLCLPVSHDKDISGVLFLGSYEKTSWTDEDMNFFQSLSKAIALTLHRKQLFEHLQEKITELNFSFEVGASSLASFMGSTRGIDETTIRILDAVRSILKVDRASLMLYDPATQELQTQWVRGGDFKIRSPMRLPPGQGLAGWALKGGEPYWSEYAMGDPHYIPSANNIRSLLCVPVFTMDHRPLGVINAVTLHETRAFTEKEINFLKVFGQQAALAIENAQLHQHDKTNIERLKELNATKSQFLSLISHDLRVPLTGIRGFAEILKQQSMGRLNRPQMDLVDQLERQVDLQARMVNDLLDFARMEKGQFSIHPMPTDLGQLLEEVTHSFDAEVREHKLVMTVKKPAMALPALPLDEGRIRQVLWNLLHNAIKFTPEGGSVSVSVSLETEQVRIEVVDSGIGLSPVSQEKVFDKFFQVSPGGNRESRGLGLGLAICKEIVQAHQGRIAATSAGIGKGTTITFWLPIPSPVPERHTSAA